MLRRKAPAGVLTACLLVSLGINLGVVVASTELLLNQGQALPVTAGLRKPRCGAITRELGEVVAAAPLGRPGRLGLELRDVLLGPECEEEPLIVALVDPEELPREPLEPLEPEPEPEREKPRPKPEKEPEPEKELEEQPVPVPEPEPEKEPEPEPQPEQPQEKIDFVLEQLKMVEQLDEHDEEHAPDDAHYLSNINREVLEETRAKMTNLIRDADEAKAQPLEKSDVKEEGTADEQKIAEEREQKSQLARLAPPEPVAPKPALPEQNDPKPKSLLSMRDLKPREHSEAMTKLESQANSAADGTLDAERPEQAPIAARDEQRARTRSNEKIAKFRLSQNDLTAMFGKDLDAQKALVSERQSKQKGVWENARERWQSPLENMVPEVKMGNQTALRSRKHPFARYIATIHRGIHDLWAWGFLEQLDTQPRSHPFNQGELWTRVEIVLLGDGTIDKVRTVRFSGNTGFDAAAREIVYAAGPYPQPPREILSGNGKVYIHWAFHRDERACGTFGAEPFILDNAGQGDRPDPSRPVRATTSEAGANESRRLSRQLPSGSVGPEGPALPPGAPGPAPPPGPKASPEEDPDLEGEAPRRRPPRPGGGLPPALPPLGEGGEGGGEASDAEAEAAAGKAANGWLYDFGANDVDKLVLRSSVPFYAGDQIVARTKEELRGVLQAMLDESKGAGKPASPRIYSAAGLRKELGNVPAGVNEGNGRLFALTRIGGDPLVLILERRFGAWRLIGIAR